MRPWWVIQNTGIEGPGLFAEAFEAAGLRPILVPAWDGAEVPESPDGAGGIVILGGPMGVYEGDRYPQIAREITLTRRALQAGVSFLGICLGGQILASAAGGKVYPGPRAELGWAPVTLTPEGKSDPILGGGEGTLDVFHWHGDTFDLPPSATHLARSDAYANQAFRVGRRAYGFQFHLEFTAQIIDAVLADPENQSWMRERASGVTAEGIREDTLRRAATCAARAREVFARFLASAIENNPG
jgi:GMP synthase (glutamine-hydrolysing)